MQDNVIAVEIGNSMTKLGCFVAGRLEAIETLVTEKNHPETFLEDWGDSVPLGFEAILLASVVPEATRMVQAVLARNAADVPVFEAQTEQLDQYALSGLDLSAYSPGCLGMDRVLNLIGAREHFPAQSVVALDAGTTTTIDLLDAQGRFVGGAICPGPRKVEALVGAAHAAQLPVPPDVFQVPRQTPGCSTMACLENGLYYGYKGLVLEILGNLLQSAGWPLSQVRFVFTGGDGEAVSRMVAQEIPRITVDRGLTLQGLYRLWQWNPAHAVRLEEIESLPIG